jgi:anti-sigma B factor antagonist
MTSLEIEHYEGVPVVHVAVDVDSASALKLRDQLIACVPHGASDLVVDLSTTRYLDSAGIDMLFRLNQRLTQRRGSLRLVIPPESQLARLAKIVALPSAIPVHPSVEDAIATSTQKVGRSQPG